MKEKACIICDL